MPQSPSRAPIAGAVAHRGEIFHLRGNPADSKRAAVHYPDGMLVVRDGHIVACGSAAKIRPRLAKTTKIVEHQGLIVPGFVDTHVHYPQLDVIASGGTDLLGWLERYTFPAEMAFADRAHAAREAEAFLDAMLAAGTTTALVFCTVHAHSADCLFEAARKRNLRLIAGKVLMDRGAPKPLRDTAETGIRESEQLIRKWHNRGRLSYAITPRFAVTSSSAQLEGAGKLLAAHPDVYLHTHLSENAREIKEVARLFPEARSYLDVYHRHRLTGPRSVFAHSIHLDRADWSCLARTQSSIAFCPSSNLFLGSGLFKFAEAARRGVRFGLGSDVGGGTSLSMLRMMDEGYKVIRMGGTDCSAFDLWYRATLGGAEALALDKRIGNFAAGKEADFAVLDLAGGGLLAKRLRAAKALEERMFAIAMLASDRSIKSTYVAGARVRAK